MNVVDVRLMSRQPLNGTTATSFDLDLSGPLRNLCWALVDDDAGQVVCHLLIDSTDRHAAIRQAMRIAPTHLGHQLTCGIAAATLDHIANAVVRPYPPPASTIEESLQLSESSTS